MARDDDGTGCSDEINVFVIVLLLNELMFVLNTLNTQNVVLIFSLVLNLMNNWNELLRKQAKVYHLLVLNDNHKVHENNIWFEHETMNHKKSNQFDINL